MNITLIGMSGAGKSYIGKRLAERLGLEMVDSDVLLAEAFGKDIQSILDELGEKDYIPTEAKMHIDATRGRENLLISPAGSVIYHDDWMKHLKDNSNVVYLHAPFEVIEARLKNKPPRAIIGLGKKTLRQLYDERHPLYEKNAHHVVDTRGREADEVMNEIMELLQVEKED